MITFRVVVFASYYYYQPGCFWNGGLLIFLRPLPLPLPAAEGSSVLWTVDFFYVCCLCNCYFFMECFPLPTKLRGFPTPPLPPATCLPTRWQRPTPLVRKVMDGITSHNISRHRKRQTSTQNLRTRTRREKRRLTLRMALLPLGPFFIIIIIINIIIVRFVHVPVITLSSALCLVPLMPLNIQGGTFENKKRMSFDLLNKKNTENVVCLLESVHYF